MSVPRQVWGNTTGWVFAGLFVLAVGFGIVTLGNLSAATRPTGLLDATDAWRPFETPVDLTDVLATAGSSAGRMNSGSTDGGRAYRLLVNGYTNTPEPRQRLQDFLGPTVVEPSRRSLPLMNLLRQGAVSQSATIFAGEPETLVNYDRDLKPLEALETVGKVAIKQAGLLVLRSRDADPEAAEVDQQQAIELYLAAVVLGQRLQQERLTYAQFQTGAELLAGGLGGLAALSEVRGDTVRAAKYRAQRDRLREHMTGPADQMWSALATINDPGNPADAADRHAGDVLALAGNDEAAPMWRVEAVLRTGKYRHDATRRGDVQLAERLLEQLADEPADGALRVAIAEALNLTAEQRRIAR
ncbi:MAG: hypothetical protein AAGK78_07400 [Planctomycetota bacterium]